MGVQVKVHSVCRRKLVNPCCAAGLLTLSGYLRFWGWVYLAFTLLLAVFKSEGRPPVPAAHAATKKHDGSGGSRTSARADGGSGTVGKGLVRRSRSPAGGGEPNGWSGPSQQLEGEEEEGLSLRDSYLQLW